MPSQLRIYRIRDGQMENWLKFFHEKVVPLHRRFGIPVRAGWINAPASEFIWVRDFADGEPVEEQERRYVAWDERRKIIGDEAKTYIDSMEVRVVERAYMGEG